VTADIHHLPRFTASAWSPARAFTSIGNGAAIIRESMFFRIVGRLTLAH